MNGTKFEVDLELLKKYSKAGPRYTSYPTAPHFRSDFGPEEFREQILANQNSKAPLSLYFHLPFCKSMCYYCGCNFIITHSPDKIQDYIQWLKKEILLLSPFLKSREVVQLHWGGGSPDYLSSAQIEELATFIQGHFTFSPQAEISMEIDPRRLTPDHLPMIRKLGFNRLSFGVQDFNPQVQKTINRIQPESLTRSVVEESRALGFPSTNLDMIYGLPYQTMETYQKTLEIIQDLQPDRLAIFNYAHVPWLKKHQNLIPEEALPKPEERLKMLKLIIETLTASGYEYIGMDHFAKPEDELTKALHSKTLSRNFQGYTTWRGAEVYAFGITAISQLDSCYAQNHKTIAEYKQSLEEGKIPTLCGYVLSEDDKLRRYVITELMCNNQIIKSDVEKKFSIDFNVYFANALSQLTSFVEDGLMKILPDRLEVLTPGRLVIRNMAMAFDAYLKENTTNLYSKTV